MERVEHVCRDYLAVSLRGHTEVPAGQDRIDVAVPEDNLLIEVKGPSLAPAGLKAVVGQLQSYGHFWESAHGVVPRLRLHWVLSANRLDRRRQVERIAQHQRLFEGIEITTEVMPSLPSAYDLAGHEIGMHRPVSDIQKLCTGILNRYGLFEHLEDDGRAVLLALTQAIYPQARGVELASVPYGGVMIYAVGGVDRSIVPISAAIQAWLRRTHYQWWFESRLVCGGLS
jgi:hypothetical protein